MEVCNKYKKVYLSAKDVKDKGTVKLPVLFLRVSVEDLVLLELL